MNEYIATQALNPEWEKAGRVHDWRNHVSTEIRMIWDEFSDNHKVALALDADERAGREEWE